MAPVAHRPLGRLAARPRTHRRRMLWSARQWAALVSVLSGYLVGALTVSSTAIALPSIAAELNAGPVGIQWFVTGYLLAATCLVLIAGALGDRFGRRLVLRIAASLYALGIGGSAVASSIAVLDISRVVAGIGSAGLMACGAAVLTSSFQGADRIKAFALCGSAGGIGLAIGPSAAGWIVAAVGWRGTFAMLSVASLLMVLSTFLIAESKADQPRRFDGLGALMLIAGLSSLLLGISAATAGAGLVAAAELIGAVVILALFTVRCLRITVPLLEFGVLRDRVAAAWLVASVTAIAGMAGFTVYLPTYLLVLHGLAAGAAGTWMLAYTVPLFLTPMLASRWVNRGGSPARLAAVSLTLAAAGLGGFVLMATATPGWAVLLPTAVIGFAIGVLTGLCDGQLMGRIDTDRIGMASGLLNTVRSGVMSILLAVFGAGLVLAISTRVGPRWADQLAPGNTAGIPTDVATAGFGYGWAVVLGVNALVFVVATGVFVLLIRTGRARH